MDLTSVVRKEIVRLQKSIAEQTAVLGQLTKELNRHEKVAAMLADGSTPHESARRTKPTKKSKSRAKPNSRTNWNSLLEGLPRSFTAAQVKQAAGEASNQADVHQALLRWRKAGRVTTSTRGKYRKSSANS